MKDPTRCFECGGTFRRVAKAGRVWSHRGQPGFLVPADFAVLTCDRCGTEMMNAAEERQIDAEFDRQLAAKRRHADQATVNKYSVSRGQFLFGSQCSVWSAPHRGSTTKVAQGAVMSIRGPFLYIVPVGELRASNAAHERRYVGEDFPSGLYEGCQLPRVRPQAFRAWAGHSADVRPSVPRSERTSQPPTSLLEDLCLVD